MADRWWFVSFVMITPNITAGQRVYYGEHPLLVTRDKRLEGDGIPVGAVIISWQVLDDDVVEAIKKKRDDHG